MEAWRYEAWRYGFVEVLIRGGIDSWKYGFVEVWRRGEAWRYETWRYRFVEVRIRGRVHSWRYRGVEVWRRVDLQECCRRCMCVRYVDLKLKMPSLPKSGHHSELSRLLVLEDTVT